MDLQSLEPLRVGKPYSFVDESIGREWTINPFAFRLKDASEGGKGEAGIVLDWEHAGWEWHDPLKVSESEEFGGVPKLVNSLRRVWPEYDLGPKAGKALTSGLQRLRDDHESGARQLAAVAISTLKEVISEMGPSSVGGAWYNIRMAAWHLCKNGRESMGAAITSALVTVLGRIESIFVNDDALADSVQRILGAIDEQVSQRQASTTRIRDNFVQYLRDTLHREISSKGRISVLTLSSSSTISTSLLEAAAALGVVLDLRILESRPNCEGASLAAKLLRAAEDDKTKVNITLYTDASAALAADGVDVVLLGADRISAGADVSNKTGSLPTVLSARHVAPEAKIVILSETDKIAGPGSVEEHVVEDNDPLEVTAAWKAAEVQGQAEIESFSLQRAQSGSDTNHITIKNTYFEWVPARLIDAYVTEQGLWSSDDIAKRSQWIGNETDRLFRSL